MLRDTTGAPVARAEMFVGLDRVADPTAPGGCEDRTGDLLALARVLTDSSGRYEATLPVADESKDANCVVVWAALRLGLEPWGERPVAHALWQAVPLSSEPLVVDLVLTALPPFRTDAARGGRRPRRRPDDDWAEAASGPVPGFGGFILDGCNVVVYLTSKAAEDAATEYVRSSFRDVPTGRQPCPPPRPIVFRRATYDYAQLRRWYDQATIAMSLAGVTFMSINAQANRIRIGVADSAAERRVRRALATTDVPRDAVVVDVAFPHGRPEQPRFGPDVPKLGARLAAQYNAIAPAWSPDSREIFFQTLDGGPGVTDFSLRGVDVTSRRVRRVTSMVGMNSGRHATGVASDGQIFFALSDSASRRSGDVIYRVSPRGGAPERVLEGLAWPWLAVSADGRRIAHVAPLDAAPHRELLAVTDLPTGRRFTVATRESSRGAILGLSPDGRYLVHTIDYTSDPDSVGAWLVSLEDGVARRIVALSPAAREGPSRIVGGLRWVGEAPHLLLIEATAARSRLALTVVDGARGTRRLIGTVLAGERQPVGTAWSPDGNRVAIWLPIAIGPEACVPGGVCISRRLVHYRLYLFDARTGSTRMLAERVGTEGPRWLEFSPDGRWLAYSLFGDIRVHRL